MRQTHVPGNSARPYTGDTMQEPPFTITRRTPLMFEAINGGAVFMIAREAMRSSNLVCSYGGIARGPDERIRWGSVPIAIRKAARQHFASQWHRALAA
jgi:hypothetical protein